MLKTMAKNNGKKQLKFNTSLQETMEEEGMNRRLKEAGIYDHNDSYEIRKQLDAMLEQSKEDANKTTPDLPSKQLVTSFEDEFNKVDDDDLTEINIKDASSSANMSGKKQPVWHELPDDEDEDFQTNGENDKSLKVASKPFQKNASKLQKAKTSSADSKKLVQPPVESYGYKMAAASIKKGEDSTLLPNSSRNLSSRKGDLIISPDEVAEIEEFPEMIKGSSRNGYSRKDETTLGKKSDTEDDDFILDPPPSRQKENINRNKMEQSNPGQKFKIASMKALCKKYSEMLNQIENVTAFPLPEDPSYDDEGPCQRLIENEERLKVAQSSGYKPIKWRKPIILGTTNSRRRRQIFNQPSTSRNTSPREAEEDGTDAVEIVCDSPPADSMGKLDISPASPIFESSASRKRSSGSNGIIEAEMDVGRKSPIDIKEDSATQECPICGKLFPLNVIEDHADGCINNMEERPRSERVARSTRSNKSYLAWSANSQWGKGLDRAAGSSTASDAIESDGSQPDSDFEPEYDPGTKRSQRKTESVGVKKRRT